MEDRKLKPTWVDSLGLRLAFRTIHRHTYQYLTCSQHSLYWNPFVVLGDKGHLSLLPLFS